MLAKQVEGEVRALGDGCAVPFVTKVCRSLGLPAAGAAAGLVAAFGPFGAFGF